MIFRLLLISQTKPCSVHRADTVAVECIPSPATMVILTPRYTRILHAVYCGIVRAAVVHIVCQFSGAKFENQ